MAQSGAAHHHDHDHGPASAMIPVEEARELILASIQPLAPIELPLQEAHGCVLAADAVAQSHLPEFSSSAMDGYACRSHDVADASAEEPVTLRIVGLARIGRRPEATVGGGEAVRIDTGAPVPAGADCVVPIEYAEAVGDRVRVLRPFAEGRN